ncbi:hypothetical protein [Microvirga lotononidis]|uniref:Uncharacterized protein n=1 Tax=Microvirga lotononidis TaxID=864069 RepID=I4YN71_9HYPH|nr:hypothetical protein [Microvirga lotononidis]EIM25413.1 hypothetical protein MicloDRAFT_00061390 [Microvirga lotononidis]WQO27293.1 hypothetical protein U0023_22030 [Microvirga lotononidis]
MRDTTYILFGLGAAILVFLAFLFRAMFFGLGLRAVGDKFAKWIGRRP